MVKSAVVSKLESTGRRVRTCGHNQVCCESIEFEAGPYLRPAHVKALLGPLNLTLKLNFVAKILILNVWFECSPKGCCVNWLFE